MGDIVLNIFKELIHSYTLEQRVELYKKVFKICNSHETKIDIFDAPYEFALTNNEHLDEKDIDFLLRIPIVIEDILKSNLICLKILYCALSDEPKYNKSILKKAIMTLARNNYVPDLYFNKFVLSFTYLSSLITSDIEMVIELLELKKLSFDSLCSHMDFYQLFKTNQMDAYFNEYIKFQYVNLNISTQHNFFKDIFVYMLKNPNAKKMLNCDSLEIIINHLASYTTSFQISTHSNTDTQKVILNCELLIDFLSSDLPVDKIIAIYNKIDPNIKMKDVISNEQNKQKFIDMFRLFKPEVLSILCNNKGSTITKYCFKELMQNLSGNTATGMENAESFFNDELYCRNFIILLEITQSTVSDMIENEKLNKKEIESVVYLICSLYPEIVKLLTLNLIDDFNLYECVEPSIINSLGFKLLLNYYKDPYDSKLEVYPVNVVTQIIASNIEFVDYATILTLLCNLYSENIYEQKEIEKINIFVDSIKQYIEKYNVNDVSRLLINMILKKRSPLKFLETYFKVVPAVKSNIVSIICSKIYVELQLQQFAVDSLKITNPSDSEKSYDISSPLLSLYNMLTSHHKQKENSPNDAKEKILVSLKGIDLNVDDIDIQIIESMLNSKTCSDYFVEQNTCKICFDEQCKITLVPCGHLLCEKCTDDYVKHKHKCPFCNECNVTPIKMYYV